MSGTTDTVSGGNSDGVVRCACGRVHTRPQRRRARKGPELDLGSKVYAALLEGRAQHTRERWLLHLHRDCTSPIMLAANDDKRTFAHRWVRCRKCGACRRARMNYWGFAGMEQTKLSVRTWFGTLTLTPEWQGELLDRARLRSPTPNAEWWSEPQCDARFAAVRDEFLSEVQRYWKRLRKSGHLFKYLLVFERHKSGLPHAHFLLHECAAPIRKRELRSQWPFGHFQAKLVSDGERAAWYVVKYLSKSDQARQIASAGYRPVKRSGIAQPKAERVSEVSPTL